ncbi:Transcriptional regulator, partial [Dysosmobacter welbionis]
NRSAASKFRCQSRSVVSSSPSHHRRSRSHRSAPSGSRISPISSPRDKTSTSLGLPPRGMASRSRAACRRWARW